MLKNQTKYGFLLSDVARLMRRNFNRRVQSIGLTEAQWKIVVRLSMMQGARQSRLAELMEMHPISIARLIDRLSATGWVERRADPQDRRAVNLYLTKKVEPVIDKMWNEALETRQLAFTGISQADQDKYFEVLEKMRDNLTMVESNYHD